MTRQLFIHLALIALGAVNIALAQPKAGQPAPPAPRPDLRPGDKLEVIDMGQIREAEFVEFTPVGLIKVRFEDDSQLAFTPNKVRWAKGIAPRRDSQPATKPAGTQPATTSPPASQPSSTRLRKWLDATGKFSIEAEFAKLDGDKVQLKKAEGRMLTLPLDKLSAADQEVAKALAAAANPFEANVSERPGVAAQPGGKVVPTSLQGIPSISLAAPAMWTAKVDPGVTPPAIAAELRDISPGAGIFDPETVTQMLPDPANHWIWISLSINGAGDLSSRLERTNLHDGKEMDRISIPPIAKLFAIDPSGKYLATFEKDEALNRSVKLDLWEIGVKQLRRAPSFKPYDNGDASDRKPMSAVVWGEFIDSTRLLTRSDKGTLVLWNLATFKAEYQIELGDQYACCVLSPGRKQLAVGNRSGVYVLEALSGKVLGKCELKNEGVTNTSIWSLAFSTDGTQLAAVGPFQVGVWNVADGQNTSSFAGTAIDCNVNGALSFGTHNHLIIDHRYAFDIERGLMTCKFEGNWHETVSYAGREWYLFERYKVRGSGRGLSQFALPGDAVMAKAKSFEESELLAIPPGAKVSLQLNLPFEPAEIEKIRASTVAAIQINGWEVVAPGAAGDFTFIAATSPGMSEQVVYNMEGRPFTNEKTTVAQLRGEMQLKATGSNQIVWQRQTSWSPPRQVIVRSGQTVADATRASPRAEFFLRLAIPRRIFRYPARGAIVNATLSPEGLTVE